MANGHWKTLLHDRLALAGFIIVLLMCLIALLAPLLAPHDPIRQFDAGLTDQGLPVGPSTTFPLGTDDLGRDILSRLMYGARVSLEVGLFANILAVGFGIVLGVSSGFFGGWVETVIMRFTDFMMAFPFLLFVMALVAVLQPSITNIFIAIASIGWITTARVLRAETRVLAGVEYVTAARALGCSVPRILVRHILPQLVGKVAVLASLGIAFTILLEAGLSFLGIGVPPPTPSWGTMLREGQDFYSIAPILMIAPGLCIVLTVIGFNLLAEGVDRALDPRRPGANRAQGGARNEVATGGPPNEQSGTAVPSSLVTGRYAAYGPASRESGPGADPSTGMG